MYDDLDFAGGAFDALCSTFDSKLDLVRQSFGQFRQALEAVGTDGEEIARTALDSTLSRLEGFSFDLDIDFPADFALAA